MIAYIKGELVILEEDRVVVDTVVWDMASICREERCLRFRR